MGLFDEVEKSEVDAMREALKTLAPKEQPKA